MLDSRVFHASLYATFLIQVDAMRYLPFSLFVLLSVALPVSAHEFWISPKDYTVAPGEQVVADIRVGQNFKGGAYSFVPGKIVRFDLVQGDNVTPVTGVVGDRPAMTMKAPAEGLVIAVHQTTDYFLTYTDPEKFVNFVTHKDFDGVLEEHKARGLPDSGFRERYSRFGKSLIAVGGGEGADRVVGMETEIVALANPYTDDLSAGLPVQVFYQGAVRASVQVELFAKAPDGTVAITQYTTDEEGRVSLPVLPGHEYLVDSVVMRALEKTADKDPAWESLWASLTFRIPED